MKHLLLALCLAIAALISPPPARADVTAGWWWNANESGRGYFLEQQGSAVFFAAYYYESTGRATWAVASLAPLSAQSYSGSLISLAGGQSLTGSWQAAGSQTSLGTVTLSLVDAEHATLTWPGGTTSLERFNVVPGGTTAARPSGTPETGWWWNSAESGRGFALEIQNGALMLAGYMYETTGSPVWYLSIANPMASSTSHQGVWGQYANGQALGGAYKAPTVANANVGAVGITFHSSIAATMSLPDGRQIPLTRFAFGDAKPLTWTPNLRVDPVAATTVGTTAYYSSSRLRLVWDAPSGATISHYNVSWTDQVTGQQGTATVTATGADLADLKAATSYLIEVTACAATSCAVTQKASASATTPSEVWQLQGSGNTVSGLTKIVSDGNVKIHAMRYGADATSGLAGRIGLYYGPSGSTVRGLATGITGTAASTATPSSYLSFTSRAGSSGLISPSSAATLVKDVATGQAIPLTTALGAKVRLFFEAAGADNKTRIMYVDSSDGWVGADFNSGSAATCSTQADYGSSGGCAPTVVIGVEGDAVASNSKIANARQFKIGYPTQSDWRWDGAAGTFMVFTTDRISGCTDAQMNHGYAVWSGSAWTVQYAASGCPKLFAYAQAAHPLHLGGVRYKMVYGDTSDTSGRIASSSLPFLGPKRLIYADGARTGEAARVDYEDWETTAQGRRLQFLWPNGETLSSTAEGYIDDFTIIAPTGDLALQVLYLAITDGTIPPFSAAAVLLNP